MTDFLVGPNRRTESGDGKPLDVSPVVPGALVMSFLTVVARKSFAASEADNTAQS